MWIIYLPESFQAARQVLPHPHGTEDICKTRETADLPKVTQPKLRFFFHFLTLKGNLFLLLRQLRSDAQSGEELQ